MKSKNTELNEAKGLGGKKKKTPSVTPISHRGGLGLLCTVPK